MLRTLGKRGLFSGSMGLMHSKHLKEMNEHLITLLKRKLWLQIIIGMILGVMIGLIFGPSTGLISEEASSVLGEWLALPGMFFLAMIQVVVVPLVFASVLKGITSSGSLKKLKRKGLILVAYFLIVSGIAVAIGVVVGHVIQPGSYIDPDLLKENINTTALSEEITNGDEGGKTLSLKTIPEEVVSVIPTNPLGAMLNSQMLQVVILSFIVGFSLLSLNKKTARPILDLMGSVQSVCMAIVKWVMYIAPLAVLGLMAKVTLQTGLDVLIGLGFYVLTVIFGLFILMLLFLLIVSTLGRRNPLKFLSDSKEALLMAFSTDSSAAVIPLSIRTAEEKMNIDPSTSQFVIPIGATVNMSGTALYQGLATMFMAQLFGLELPLSVLLALIVTAVGASIGTPATPGVGIIILSSVLTSAGIPLAGIPLILGVDRILEMSRAALNVMGDLVACTVLDSGKGKDIVEVVKAAAPASVK
ncbi:MAG: dicarboxylate/amino acid:cation symporter [Candidatus Woesearchaeota archaeon]